ncbi:Uncharacterised protein [Escherichia coli]|nr:Uncharacterised protein [Escherichia coli]CAD5737720.1 Uncharacterised protein [Escherichia coli]CAD5749597.1 Uncharacterised protein [Escherichia coli]
MYNSFYPLVQITTLERYIAVVIPPQYRLPPHLQILDNEYLLIPREPIEVLLYISLTS